MSKHLSFKGYGPSLHSFSADQQDAGVPEDNVRIVKETAVKLGGLDIIVANAGWTRFSDFKDLNALSLEEWNKV